jgi:hypothetical protein
MLRRLETWIGGERGRESSTNKRGIKQPEVSDYSLLGQEVITPGGEKRKFWIKIHHGGG